MPQTEFLESLTGSGRFEGFPVLQPAARNYPELLASCLSVLEQENTVARVDHDKACGAARFGLHGSLRYCCHTQSAIEDISIYEVGEERLFVDAAEENTT